MASIARENVEKVLRRDDKLHDLDSRAADLHTGAQNFSNQATKLKRKVSLFGGEFGQNLFINHILRFGGETSKCG